MTRSTRSGVLFAIGLALSFSFASAANAEPNPTHQEVRAIAKDAFIYAFPVADNYRIQYAYFVDKKSSQYKGPWNEIVNIARVYTPEDTAIQAPNSDTPYSFMGMDLRAEPIVLTIPPIEKDRYFTFQFVDQYTYDFAYLGSRTTGNSGGKYLVAGPNWHGETPKGINKVIRSETEFVFLLIRTQLFNPADLPNVVKIQHEYKAQPLSTFLGEKPPKAAPDINFVEPLTREQELSSVQVFNTLNFVLQFCPTNPAETDVRARFATIGIHSGNVIDFEKLSPELLAAYTGGIADANIAIAAATKEANEGKITSGEVFGTREYLNGNYMYRLLAAKFGIYGNAKQEAMYPIFAVDSNGQPLDAAKANYTLHFAKGEFPPVNAFWSLTMYNLPERLLIENPINRYLINSPMLPDLKLDKTGGLTMYLQHLSPGKDLESNWLPAPNGLFIGELRLYWPKAEAIDGQWKAPKVEKVR